MHNYIMEVIHISEFKLAPGSLAAATSLCGKSVKGGTPIMNWPDVTKPLPPGFLSNVTCLPCLRELVEEMSVTTGISASPEEEVVEQLPPPQVHMHFSYTGTREFAFCGAETSDGDSMKVAANFAWDEKFRDVTCVKCLLSYVWRSSLCSHSFRKKLERVEDLKVSLLELRSMARKTSNNYRIADEITQLLEEFSGKGLFK